MSALNRLLDPLRSAAAAFFKHDLAVRREGPGVRLVLEERPRDGKKARRPSRAEMIERKEKEELAQMRAELAALLNELPETRQTMRHLVFVERALAKKGLRALHKLPLDVLQRALEQFEGLVVNWSPVGLANLRSKMAVAVIDREHMGSDAEGDAYRTAAILESTPPPAAAADGPALSEDEALAAAYAALGASAPDAALGPAPSDEALLSAAYDAALSAAAYGGAADDTGTPGDGVEMQAELGARSAKTLTKFQNSTLQEEKLPTLKMRELEA